MKKKIYKLIKKIWGWVWENRKKIYKVIKEIWEWVWVFFD